MATPETELDYLSPGFDPSSLTMPKLRSVLVAHNVAYPSSAKKPQLVALFNENVKPQAKNILSARSRTTRSARGIQDVPSSQASTVTEEEEVEPPPPVQPAKRASRRTTRAPPDEDGLDAVALGLTASKTPKRGSSKHARASDAEPDERPAVRRSRHSMLSPEKRAEEPDAGQYRPEEGESPFTTDNPFQSGSSPVPEIRSRSGDGRRKTFGVEPARERRKSSSGRRKTDYVTREQRDDGIVPPSRKTFDVPIARAKKEREPPEDDAIETGEEFTPEEQLALVRERASNGERDILPPRRKARAQGPTGILKVAPLAVTLAMLGGLATVWRQEKIEVGYCGVGRPSTSLAGVELPDWASIIQPQCEPCPQHAYCYPELRTVCEPDFVLKPHPLSLGGLVPLPPTCEPDGEKSRKVKAVADRAVEELRERNAKWECGELLDEDGRHIPLPELDEEALKQEMSNKRRKGMSQSEFEDLWKGAIGEITGREEVESNIDGEGNRRTLRSTSLARVPLACAIRRSIRLALVRHLGKLVILFLFLASGGYARWSIAYNREMEARAKQLASYALDRLAVQAALHAQDPHAYGEAYIPMGQLRDDVLRDEFSATRRQRLWERVQKKVEGNSNIRPMVREGRSGDVSRVWEWVGAIRAIEGVDGGSARRESSRFSFGPIAGSSPAVGSSLIVGSSPIKEDEGIKREMMQMNKWDEGRPIY
ncbi:hypothetical protein W97_07455 [Coniosporium apollinis CBS 100218]|uniref:LEM-like domain-containing protein n=1 Tax=Coniosporium apollinis (strain CBS 100218) TaxID=1168221 RepID=R7Z1J0_CONA1|nr:uncharacterized protein W97_07455 [Coniosporium apollinis CBS 100218]EON67958.1 hypothetical protein W97_07455 [Coniosporium apollinis CBS 100218]